MKKIQTLIIIHKHYHKMWSDDKHWLPLFLDGKKFKGKFMFDENNSILNYELNESLFNEDF